MNVERRASNHRPKACPVPLEQRKTSQGWIQGRVRVHQSGLGAHDRFPLWGVTAALNGLKAHSDRGRGLDGGGRGAGGFRPLSGGSAENGDPLNTPPWMRQRRCPSGGDATHAGTGCVGTRGPVSRLGRARVPVNGDDLFGCTAPRPRDEPPVRPRAQPPVR